MGSDSDDGSPNRESLGTTSQPLSNSHLSKIKLPTLKKGVPWDPFIDQVEMLFIRHGVTNDADRMILLATSLDQALYAALMSKIAPKKVNSLAYNELYVELQQICDPRPSLLRTRFDFFQ